MKLYVRVEDPDTGYRFDVLESSILLRKGVVKRVDARRYPPSRQPRKYKIFRRLVADVAGQSATQIADSPTGASDEATTNNKESDHGRH